MNPKDRIKELQQELTHAPVFILCKDAPTMSDLNMIKYRELCRLRNSSSRIYCAIFSQHNVGV